MPPGVVPTVVAPKPVAPKPAAAASRPRSKLHTWHGRTPNEIEMENRITMDKHIKASKKKGFVRSAGDPYWCKEVNGRFTVRTAADIYNSCRPGHWTVGEEGYPSFTRQ